MLRGVRLPCDRVSKSPGSQKDQASAYCAIWESHRIYRVAFALLDSAHLDFTISTRTNTLIFSHCSRHLLLGRMLCVCVCVLTTIIKRNSSSWKGMRGCSRWNLVYLLDQGRIGALRRESYFCFIDPSWFASQSSCQCPSWRNLSISSTNKVYFIWLIVVNRFNTWSRCLSLNLRERSSAFIEASNWNWEDKHMHGSN